MAYGDIQKLNGDYFMLFDDFDVCPDCGKELKGHRWINIQKAVDKILKERHKC